LIIFIFVLCHTRCILQSLAHSKIIVYRHSYHNTNSIKHAHHINIPSLILALNGHNLLDCILQLYSNLDLHTKPMFLDHDHYNKLSIHLSHHLMFGTHLWTLMRPCILLQSLNRMRIGIWTQVLSIIWWQIMVRSHLIFIRAMITILLLVMIIWFLFVVIEALHYPCPHPLLHLNNVLHAPKLIKNLIFDYKFITNNFFIEFILWVFSEELAHGEPSNEV